MDLKTAFDIALIHSRRRRGERLKGSVLRRAIKFFLRDVMCEQCVLQVDQRHPIPDFDLSDNRANFHAGVNLHRLSHLERSVRNIHRGKTRQFEFH